MLNAQIAGVPGELMISGPCLARGYLHRDELTAAAFVNNPLGGGVYSRMYRSGDMAAWTEDGTVQILGRVDRQVTFPSFAMMVSRRQIKSTEPWQPLPISCNHAACSWRVDRGFKKYWQVSPCLKSMCRVLLMLIPHPAAACSEIPESHYAVDCTADIVSRVTASSSVGVPMPVHFTIVSNASFGSCD